jgi:hypothetical protein
LYETYRQGIFLLFLPSIYTIMPTDIATRALVVTLKAPTGAAKTTAEIKEITGIPYRIINAIYACAIRQGFEPNERLLRLQDA